MGLMPTGDERFSVRDVSRSLEVPIHLDDEEAWREEIKIVIFAGKCLELNLSSVPDLEILQEGKLII